MNARPKIVIIHSNSLCCLAMRTILIDIAPFVDMFRDVEIKSYNSYEEFVADNPTNAIHYFISEATLNDNAPFFRSGWCMSMQRNSSVEASPPSVSTMQRRAIERKNGALSLRVASEIK